MFFIANYLLPCSFQVRKCEGTFPVEENLHPATTTFPFCFLLSNVMGVEHFTFCYPFMHKINSPEKLILVNNNEAAKHQRRRRRIDHFVSRVHCKYISEGYRYSIGILPTISKSFSLYRELLKLLWVIYQ